MSEPFVQPKTVTIQKTSKNIKLQKLIALILIVIGIGVLTHKDQPGEAMNAVIGTLCLLGGLALYINAKIMKWWHHD